MKNRESSRKTWGKQILCIMLTAILLCGLSVSALAEEPEIKTYELVGVRFTIPAELKSTHGVVEYSAGEMGQRDPVRAIQTHHEMASPWFQKSLDDGRMKCQKGI